MNTIYTVIIGNYDYLKPLKQEQSEPWKYVCFTDQEPDSEVFELYNEQPDHLKIWDIRKIELDPNLSLSKNARKIKINFHKYIDSEFSIFIDGTFFINTDLRIWTEQTEGHDFVTISHPFDNCLYVDAQSCLADKRGNKKEIIRQVADYYDLDIPEENGFNKFRNTNAKEDPRSN